MCVSQNYVYLHMNQYFDFNLQTCHNVIIFYRLYCFERIISKCVLLMTYEWCNAVLMVSFSEVLDSYPDLAIGIYIICGVLLVMLVLLIIRFICLYACCKGCPYRSKSIFR